MIPFPAPNQVTFMSPRGDQTGLRSTFYAHERFTIDNTDCFSADTANKCVYTYNAPLASVGGIFTEWLNKRPLSI